MLVGRKSYSSFSLPQAKLMYGSVCRRAQRGRFELTPSRSRASGAHNCAGGRFDHGAAPLGGRAEFRARRLVAKLLGLRASDGDTESVHGAPVHCWRLDLLLRPVQLPVSVVLRLVPRHAP